MSIRLFISYSHDSDVHLKRTLELADRLCQDGVDCELDQYVQSPPRGWPGWAEDGIESADLVLVVCTERYFHRLRGRESMGKGKGATWEGALITQTLYEAAGQNQKFVPVVFSGEDQRWIPTYLRGSSWYDLSSSEGYVRLFRRLTDQPATPKPVVRPLLTLGPERPADPPVPALLPSRPFQSPPFPPAPQLHRVFVGREREMERLEALLLQRGNEARVVAVCAVNGMPGVGKSYLVDEFYRRFVAKFPGGQERLVLEQGAADSAGQLRARLMDRLDVRSEDRLAWDMLRARLLGPLTLLHIENVDSPSAAGAVAELVRRLPGCPVAVTGRVQGLGVSEGWEQLPIGRLPQDQAYEQLVREHRPPVDEQEGEAFKRLVEALAGLPLAVHLAAGYLTVYSPEQFLQHLRQSGLDVRPRDPGDALWNTPARAVLKDTFALSWSVLEERLKTRKKLLAGFEALGYAMAEGFGVSLGAAIAGLPELDFLELAEAASRLSLLEPVPARPGKAWRIHPLLGEWLRLRTDSKAPRARMKAWFLTRLPGRRWARLGGLERCFALLRSLFRGETVPRNIGQDWQALNEEQAALTGWLVQLEPRELPRVGRAGSQYAIANGPFIAWQQFFERGLALDLWPWQRSSFLHTLGYVTFHAGEIERALSAVGERKALELELKRPVQAAGASFLRVQLMIAGGQWDEALDILQREVIPAYEAAGDIRSRALAMGSIAEIYRARGQWDEAIRTRQEEELPVYERLGDVHARVTAMSEIASIHYARGRLDQALGIWQEEVLPVYLKLGDIRGRAFTMGKIAELYRARGQLDEAMLIRQEEVAIYEKLGEIHARAISMGQIAEIYEARGQLDEALRIRQEEVLPVLEKLGDLRGWAVTMSDLADISLKRLQLDEALRILRKEALPVFEKLGDIRSRAVTLGKIADVYQTQGKLDEALRIRVQEQIPIYEKLGDIRGRAVTIGKIAELHASCGRPEEALRLILNEALPVYKKLDDIFMWAVTMGKIANINRNLGNLDEALRIRRDEVVPIFEKLDDRWNLVRARMETARLHLMRGRGPDYSEAIHLLKLALPEAEAMHFPDLSEIRSMLNQATISRPPPAVKALAGPPARRARPSPFPRPRRRHR